VVVQRKPRDLLKQALASLPDSSSPPDAWERVSDNELTIAALQALGRRADTAETRGLAQTLVSAHPYHTQLIDADVLTRQEAIAAAAILAQVDMKFSGRLTEAADGAGASQSVMRAFEIVEGLRRHNVVVGWLRRMTAHPDAYVRSKAVSLMCEANSNPALVAKHLDSPDPRVRANAVEALWRVDNLVAKVTLERAARDAHHRVAVNALFGLYLVRTAGAVDRMIEVAAHPSPQFRAAIAWAMGETRDAVFQEHLDRLTRDEVTAVRTAAEAALRKSAELVQT